MPCVMLVQHAGTRSKRRRKTGNQFVALDEQIGGLGREWKQ